MKVILSGSRLIHDRDHLHAAIASCPFDITEVVCGGAGGVDLLGDQYALRWHLPVRYFIVTSGGNYDYRRLLNLAPDRSNLVIASDWWTDGKYAGPKRNRAMAIYADALIAVPLKGARRGTDSMIRAAMEHGIGIHTREVEGVGRDPELHRTGL